MQNILMFLYYLGYYGTPVLYAFSMILGVYIMYRKETLTKILGLWLIATGLSNVVSTVINLSINNVTVETASKISITITVLQGILGIVAIISLFLYAKYNYDAKGFIPIVVIQLLSLPLTTLIYFWGTKYYAKDFLSIYRFNYMQQIFASLVSVALMTIIFMAYYKNKNDEKYIPKMWRVPAAMIIINVLLDIVHIINIIGGYEDQALLNATYAIEVIINDIWMFIIPAAAVYILIRGKNKRNSRKRGKRHGHR